jgi:hypothetical protein
MIRQLADTIDDDSSSTTAGLTKNIITIQALTYHKQDEYLQAIQIR